MAKPKVKPSVNGSSGREVLNLSSYVTYFFTVVANKLSSGASRLYLKRFGIGIIEWRVMAMLAIEPNITPARICQVIGLDKAAVSREMRKLEKKGYLKVSDDPAHLRRKSLELTARGYGLHEQVIQVALARERILLSDLSNEEVATLLDLLTRTTAKIPLVNDYDPDNSPAPGSSIGAGVRRNRSDFASNQGASHPPSSPGIPLGVTSATRANRTRRSR